MRNPDDFTHPDMIRVRSVVHDLTYGFAHPDTGRALPSLLKQAWTPGNGMLTARPSHDDVGGSRPKPVPRAPCRDDLWSHVQNVWDAAHRIAADELGEYLASDSAEISLAHIPALLEATFDGDCPGCRHCNGATKSLCVCRHRTITHELSVLHSTLRTALGHQPPKYDWPSARCPGCDETGQMSVRGDRIWCRQPSCDYQRSGTFAILACAG